MNQKKEKCANHTCCKSLDASKDPCFTCDFCREPLYCSRKCQAMDWVKHECINTIDMENVATNHIFVPYHYEDLLSLEELETVDARDAIRQTYSLRQILPDMNIQTRIQSALIDSVEFVEAEQLNRGTTLDDAGTFGIEFQFENGESGFVGGAFPRDLIFSKNKLNNKARTLGGGRVQAEASKWNRVRPVGDKQNYISSGDSLIFWPGADRVYSESIEMPLCGTATVSLMLNDKQCKTITAEYNLTHAPTTTSKAVVKNLNMQLETRIAGVLDSTSDLRTVQCTDQQGNRVVLTALVGDETATLVDVEFVAPKETLHIAQPQEWDNVETALFDCDPNNVSQMVGLAMGLELITRSDSTENDRIHDLAATISAFAREKMQNPNSELTPELASAVTEALETLHDEFIQAKRKRSIFGRGVRKFARRVRGSASVLRKARKIKNDRKLDNAQKEMQLQTIYNQLLENAKKQQDQGLPGSDFLDQAEQVYSIASMQTNKSDALVLDRQTMQYNLARSKEATILARRDTRKKENKTSYGYGEDPYLEDMNSDDSDTQ